MIFLGKKCHFFNDEYEIEWTRGRNTCSVPRRLQQRMYYILIEAFVEGVWRLFDRSTLVYKHYRNRKENKRE